MSSSLALKPGINSSQKYIARKVSCPQELLKYLFDLPEVWDLPTALLHLQEFPYICRKMSNCILSGISQNALGYKQACLLLKMRFNSCKYLNPTEIQKGEMDSTVVVATSVLLVPQKHPRLTLSSLQSWEIQ